MATDSGFSNQKKKGIAQYETIHNLGSSSYGKSAASKALFEILPSAAIVSVSDILGSDGQVQYWNIELTGHTASVGNTLRFDSGSLLNSYFEIMQVIDVDNFYVLPISDIKPAAAMTATVMGWVTQKMSVDGEVSVSITSTPTSYEYDGLPQTVIQDTADSTNNRALPNLNFIYKEGLQVPVTDSATPANVIAMPVKIMSAGGSNINITAGDINIQTTDMGASFDSIRVGDGSGNYIGVNASAEAKVHDADSLAELVLIKASAAASATAAKQDLLLAELQLKADLTETQPVSVASLPLPTGAATEAKQDTGNTSLSSIDAKLTSPLSSKISNGTITAEIKPLGTQVASGDNGLVVNSVIHGVTTGGGGSFVDVKVTPSGALTTESTISGTVAISAASLPLPTGAATEVSLASLLAKFGTLGQKANVGSAPVTLSTEQQALLSDISTKLDTVIVNLDILATEAQTTRNLDSTPKIIATNPAVLAPSGARGFVIQNSIVANGALRFTQQGGGASATVGFYLGVGQSTSYIEGAANLALFDVDGLGFDATIIWFT